MKIIYSITGVIAAFTGLFFLIGMLAARGFKGKMTGVSESSVNKIWEVLNDIEGLPKRRPEVTKVEITGKNTSGLPIWKEDTDMGGYIVFEMKERSPKKFLHLIMKESTFGMSGSWKYTLEAEGAKTRITVEEESLVTSIPVRTMLTLAGRDANLKKELSLLGVKF